MTLPFDINNLKALSISQPWATLIIKGYKNIENRTWGSETGWMLVHSPAAFDKKALDKFKTVKKNTDKFPVSAILGIMYVSRIEKNCDLTQEWATGPVCWHIDFAYEFPERVEAKGNRLLWKLSDDLTLKVEKQLDNNFLDFYYIHMFCNTLNTLYLSKQTKKANKDCKEIVNKIYKKRYSEVPKKLELEIMNNHYNYKEASIKPVYPNFWEKSAGFLAMPIDLPNADNFEKQLLIGANKWFHSYIDDEKFPALSIYNLTDLKTLANLFDSGWRNKNLTTEENKAVRNALDGGGNAQFQPYKGWRQSGFGIWSHIRSSRFVNIEALPKVLEVYSTLYNGSIKMQSPSHLIFKPPMKTGGELDAHNDHGSWNDMYTRCLNCDTVEKWVENYGIQVLLHIKGARRDDGGQTTLLGPLDVHTYLIILQMIHPKTIHPDIPAPKDGWDNQWFTASGPKFYDWYHPKILALINRVVKLLKTDTKPETDSDKKWISDLKKYDFYDYILGRASKSKYEKISKIKMLPKEKFNSSYVIAWPSGFIHGSDPTGLNPRLTMTVNYSDIGDDKKRIRALKRIENIALGNIKEVLKDKEPYEGGIVHKSTNTEIDIYPFFKDIYVTEKDIPQLKEIFG